MTIEFSERLLRPAQVADILEVSSRQIKVARLMGLAVGTREMPGDHTRYCAIDIVALSCALEMRSDHGWPFVVGVLNSAHHVIEQAIRDYAKNPDDKAWILTTRRARQAGVKSERSFSSFLHRHGQAPELWRDDCAVVMTALWPHLELVALAAPVVGWPIKAMSTTDEQ